MSSLRLPVVVGVDGSEASRNAVRYAALEAQRQGSGLRLVHVAPPYALIHPMFPLPLDSVQEVGRRLLAEAEQIAESAVPDLPVVKEFRTGPTVAGLLSAAEDARAIVLGCSDMSMFERVVTGSTAVGVAAHARCPLVSVPESWEPGGELHRVVVGVKQPNHSSELLSGAFALASQRRAELVLVHAWSLPPAYDDLVNLRSSPEEWTTELTDELERQITRLRKRFPWVKVSIKVVHERAARALVRESVEADLLLLRRPPHAFPSVNLGGTARALLREAGCPVEILPPVAVTSAFSDFELEHAGAFAK